MKAPVILPWHYYNRIQSYEGTTRLKEKQDDSKCCSFSQSLDVRSNNIKGDGLSSIADAIKFNSALNELFIWGNVNEERACLVNKEMRRQKNICKLKPFSILGL